MGDRLTVSDLINLLIGYDPDAAVCIETYHDNEYLDRVELRADRYNAVNQGNDNVVVIVGGWM